MESEINQFKQEAESLKNEQQQIVRELQERKKTVKDKQVYCKRLQSIIIFFIYDFKDHLLSVLIENSDLE